MSKNKKTKKSLEIELGEFSEVGSSDEEGDESPINSDESDDENRRYMLNPDFVYDSVSKKLRKGDGTEIDLTDDFMSVEENSDDEEIPPGFVPRSWGSFTTFGHVNQEHSKFELTGNAAKLTNDSTPLEVLQVFFSDVIIREICMETNRYARNDNNKTDFEVSEGEMWDFLGLQILTGIVTKPSIKLYFSKSPVLATPYFNSVFPRNRFEEILRYFHLADNSKIDKSDRTCKFGRVIPMLMQNFRENALPGQHLCLDEFLVKFSGRLAIKQFIRTKRSRFGIKMFQLSDSTTNYVLGTLLYEGKGTKLTVDRDEFGLGGAVVMTMVDLYKYTGRNIFLDNWFTSVFLAETLLGCNLYMCGTGRRNRKLLPKFPSKQNKESRGYYKSYFNGKVVCERWQDRKEVIMLSTFIDPGLSNIKNRHGNNEFKPNSVIMYNKFMGSTDFIDKQIKPYEIIRKSYKWYKKLFFWYFDISIWNAYVVWMSLRTSDDKLTFLDFKIKLVEEIYAKFEPKRKSMGRPVMQEPSDIVRKTGQHWPAAIPGKTPRQCVVCSKNGFRKRSIYQCDRCKKALCVVGCFKHYHVN